MLFLKRDIEKVTVVKNYIALLLIQGANFILPLITFPYLVRTLGVEKYGLVMVAQSIAIFFTVIVDFGFNISATREVSLIKENKEKLSKLYWEVLSIKFFLVFISFSILFFLTLFINRFKINSTIYLLSFLVVIGQALFPTWFFQGIEKMKVITIIHVLAKIIFTLCIFTFVLSPEDYKYVPISNGLGFILTGLGGFLFSLKYIKFVIPSIKKMKTLLRESFSLFVSNFAVILYTSSNTFILGMFGGDMIAGVYSSFEKLVVALKSIYSPLYQALFPNLSRKPREDIIKFVNKFKGIIALSGGVLSMIIFFFAKDILNLVYNSVLISSYSNVFRILGFIILFSSLNMLYLSLLYTALKAYKKRMTVLVTGGVFNVIMAVVLVRFYGIYGVAISAVSTELLLLILATLLFDKKNKNKKNV